MIGLVLKEGIWIFFLTAFEIQLILWIAHLFQVFQINVIFHLLIKVKTNTLKYILTMNVVFSHIINSSACSIPNSNPESK